MKKVIVKIFFLHGKREISIVKAPAKQVFTSKGVDDILKNHAAYVEQAFPGREFRLVPLRDGNFNFVEIKVEDEPAPQFNEVNEELIIPITHKDLLDAAAVSVSA